MHHYLKIILVLLAVLLLAAPGALPAQPPSRPRLQSSESQPAWPRSPGYEGAQVPHDEAQSAKVALANPPRHANERRAVAGNLRLSAAGQASAASAGRAANVAGFAEVVHGDFPALPPDPYAQNAQPLPPLDEELWLHGGSYLYQAEGDRLNWPGEHPTAPYERLRLPEDWQEPQPMTWFSDFLGTGQIHTWPAFHWPGADGYVWEPQLVGYGGYQAFALALEQNQQRQDLIGHQLLLDFDLRLTATERFHMQLRPLGRDRTGGSYYQFSDPEGYVDNSTVTPARYWVEAELHSLLGGFVDPFVPLDHNLVVGQFPLTLHNSLLMNDEVLGVVASKNTLYLGGFSNLNVQMLYAFNDVDTFEDADAAMYGVHVSADYQKTFYEFTYAVAQHDLDAARDAYFAGISRTSFYGPLSVATRALFKWGDEAGRGSGELFVLETNLTRLFEHEPMGIDYAVFFCNAFAASAGWNSIGGGNFNRLRTAFEVNPLVRLAAGPAARDTVGVALGAQLFRHHEDESLVPEIAFEAPGGEPVWGVGVRYLRKTGPRTFVEAMGLLNFSDARQYERDGVFVGHTLLF